MTDLSGYGKYISPYMGETDWPVQCNGNDYVPLAERLRERIKSGVPFFSLEFFCPQTRAGLKNFPIEFRSLRIDCFSKADPLFVDITWSYKNNIDIYKETSTISLSEAVLNFCFTDVVLHLTSAPYTKAQMLLYLRLIRNPPLWSLWTLLEP
ncbi:unnamed protein product, partial [Soboliphyme baturini]|uniref:Methylenetetrahydrofolate reductase [NAD(P)H] n=1 Tax=Soboliphyme baturini TaxID=241478 RepID=A0A183ITV3_9BILA